MAVFLSAWVRTRYLLLLTVLMCTVSGNFRSKMISADPAGVLIMLPPRHSPPWFNLTSENAAC